MKIIFTDKLIHLILTFFIFSNVFGQGFLRADGKNIANDSNPNFILKGIGLGGWLVQEGYMLKTGALDAEYQIRQGIIELVGETRTDELYDLYHKNFVREIDIDSLAAWGFNSIRLPMHWNKLISNTNPVIYDEEGFRTIDTLLTWCKKNKMYLILDLHAAPGGQSKGGIADYNPSIPYLWDSDVMKDITVNLWGKLAQRYSEEEWIGGYDLINEPAEDLGVNAPPLRDLYIRITNEIRKFDSNHILFIEGNWYATTFDGLMPPWDNNIAYSFHKYNNETDQGTINYLVGFRNTYSVPLWLGETGENSNDWFRENVELMSNNNIGWAWWPHKKIDNIAGPLSAPVVEGYKQITDYWNGSASKPNADYAYSVLQNQFNALKFENCKIQSEVYKSLFEEKPTYSSSFVYHEIPGTIFGSDYDLGGQGVGYYDQDYKNTGSGFYNAGWVYRNGGVDLEVCEDFKRNGYNVGWIESGEWLKFTANILDSGYYNLDFRFASTTDKGIFILDIDSQNLFNMNIPNSGGWQNWITISKDSVFLPKGDHKFLLRFFLSGNTGGFNFNYMEFTSLISGVNNDFNLPKEYKLYQNYPNPFNPTSKIKYKIPENSQVTISIYNTLGEKEKILVNSQQQAGNYEFEISGTNLASGIYFCKITANSLSTNKFYNSTIKMTLLK